MHRTDNIQVTPLFYEKSQRKIKVPEAEPETEKPKPEKPQAVKEAEKPAAGVDNAEAPKKQAAARKPQKKAA